MTYHAVGMLDWAKIAFRKFISMAKAEGYIRPVCDGYLQLAICYRRLVKKLIGLYKYDFQLQLILLFTVKKI